MHFRIPLTFHNLSYAVYIKMNYKYQEETIKEIKNLVKQNKRTNADLAYANTELLKVNAVLLEKENIYKNAKYLLTLFNEYNLQFKR